MPELSKEELILRLIELEEKFEEFSRDPIQIGPGSISQSNIENIINDSFRNFLFENLWEDLFYVSSPAGEDTARYNTSGAGTVSLTDDGLTLTTTATSNSLARAQLKATNTTNIMRFDRETRFRASVTKDDTTNSEFTLLTLHDDLGANYLGFRIDDATILGLSAYNGTESTVNLGSYTANDIVSLELRYEPRQHVSFYVQNEGDAQPSLRGTLDDNLPIARTGDKWVFDAEMKTTTTTELVGKVALWEFMQRR